MTDVVVEFDGDIEALAKALSVLVRGYETRSKEDPDEEVEFLMGVLAARSPEGMYFGGHPNDPTALGYWRQNVV